jgi:uncharacterized phage protein (TIGR01671 family)
MREVKFRGLNNGEWFYGYPIYDESCTCWFIQNSFGSSISVDDSSVCQYTGLKDSKGNEIYEGDILKVNVLRLSGNRSTRYRKVNVNHGRNDNFVHMKVKFKTSGRYSGFAISKIDGVTDVQKRNIQKPIGKALYNQICDIYNFDLSHCEVIGNIHENKELLNLDK